MVGLLNDIFNHSFIAIFIVVLFVMTIIKGVIQYNKFYYVYRDIKTYINLISLYLVYLSYNFIIYELYYIVIEAFDLNYIENTLLGLLLKSVLFIGLFFIYKLMCKGIYIVLFRNIICESHASLCKLSKGFKYFVFSIFKIPKAIINVLVLVFALNTFSVFMTEEGKFNKLIKASDIYNNISNKVILPFKYNLNEVMLNVFNPLLDAFKNAGITNVRYLYNGVTIDEATKSSDEIKEFALNSTKYLETSYEKARKLYSEVIGMLEYDDQKSLDILENKLDNLSGAISAFESKKGVCFDYASLYFVLAKSVNLPTRIVVGKGFDGKDWINHAWNEVYIKELDKWINVDTTFGESSNYFDVNNFEQDHRKERIIREFSV